jgi:hypothetical protein
VLRAFRGFIVSDEDERMPEGRDGEYRRIALPEASLLYRKVVKT